MSPMADERLLIKRIARAVSARPQAMRNRVRLSIGKGPETLEKEKKAKQMATFNFDLYPQTLYIVGAPSGERYDVKAREKKSLRVINKAEDPLALVLKSGPWPGNSPLPEGYEAVPDPSWLRVRKSSVNLEGLTIGDVPLELDIPAGHGGKRYAFWVQPSLATGLEFVSGARVLVSVVQETPTKSGKKE